MQEATQPIARTEGQLATERQLNLINSPLAPPMTLSEVVKHATDKGEAMVIVSVKRAYRLTLDFVDGAYAGLRGRVIAIPQGNFKMPSALADHWWSKNNGIEKYDPPEPVAVAATPVEEPSTAALNAAEIADEAKKPVVTARKTIDQ